MQQKKFILTKIDIIPILIWLGILYMTWIFMHGANKYLALTPEALGKYYKVRWVLIAHITAGGGALITGIVQFWKKLQRFSWRLHRIIGYVYLLCIAVSGICALILASTTAYKINWGHALTLQVWSSVWLTATGLAFYFALKSLYKLHQEWMTRSYIITIAFLISGFAYKIPFIQELSKTEDIGTPLFAMGWSVPLFIYEILRSSKISVLNKRKT